MSFLLDNKKIELNNMTDKNNIVCNIEMDLTKLSKLELLAKCEEFGITKCKSKNKSELIDIINKKQDINKDMPLKKNIEFIIEGDESIENNLSNIQNVSHLKENSKYTLVDLFCGTGAFSYAFHQTKEVKTIFANDMLDSSEEIFNLNNDIKLTKKNLIDIKDIDIPTSDILTAGFPCQPFSIAGMQKGFDDERSNVFWKILSIIENLSLIHI